MKKTLICIICSILFISFYTPAYASESDNLDGDVIRVQEKTELREKNSDTYLMSDGSYECVVYSDDKYYEDSDGSLLEIDNSIVEEELLLQGIHYNYTNKANSNKFYFSDNKPAAYISSKNKYLSFELINSNDTSAVIGGSKDIASIFDFDLSGANCIYYPNVLNQTDIVYAVKNGLLKEYIVLKEKTAPTEFSFNFSSAYQYKDNDGRIEIFDNSDEIIFELEKLFAVDSAGAYTEDLEYRIDCDEEHTFITVSISPDFVNSPDRVFPILLDPSPQIHGTNYTYDTFASSKNPNTNYYLKDYLLT